MELYKVSIPERVQYIDVFRGFGILMMVMGHVGFGEIFQHWIHAFNMPMFFFISGYLYKERPLGKTVKRKAKTLLVPYFVGGGYSGTADMLIDACRYTTTAAPFVMGEY